MADWVVLVDPATGDPYKAGTGGGGGSGGDASAANQTTEIARLTSIRDATGAPSDASYASNDGSAVGTIVALLKGAYVRLFGISGQLPASLGQKTMASSLAVTLASDGGLGNQGDTAYTSADGSAVGTLVGLLKGLYVRLSSRLASDSTIPAAGSDLSGTITTGGTAQDIQAANTARRYVGVQNNSTGPLYIKFGATATATGQSITLTAGQMYENPPNACPSGNISIIGATTGQAFYARVA